MNKTVTMILGCLLIAVAPLVVLTGTIYSLMLPKIYKSSAVLGMSFPPAEKQQYTDDALVALTRRQAVLLDSKDLYRDAAEKLDLSRDWGPAGDRLPRQVVLKILQNHVRIAAHSKAVGLIEIQVLRPDPMEAADIANALADAAAADEIALQVVEFAEPNPRHVSPNLYLNVLVCTGLAVMIALGGVLLIMTGARSGKGPPPIPLDSH